MPQECEKQMKNFRFIIIYLIRTIRVIALSYIRVLANNIAEGSKPATVYKDRYEIYINLKATNIGNLWA
jgi:hypothetical protein